MPLIDPHSGAGVVLARYIDQRLAEVRQDHDALDCDDRTGHQNRGRIDELRLLREAMSDQPTPPAESPYPLP